MPAVPARLLHTLEEVQEILPVSRAQLYRLLADGRLTAVKIDRRTYVRHDVLVAFVDQLDARDVA